MEKITFINGQAPAINDYNLNKMQDNMEQAISDEIEEIKKEIVLYEDSEGTTGEITLSESIANFKYLEVFYGNGTKTLSGSTKALTSANGFCLMTQTTSNNTYWFNTAVYSMSGSKITPGNCGANSMSSNNQIITSGANGIYIFKIVGHK